jgi:hypothetical protein
VDQVLNSGIPTTLRWDISGVESPDARWTHDADDSTANTGTLVNDGEQYSTPPLVSSTEGTPRATDWTEGPKCALLSGGVDSSVVLNLLVRQNYTTFGLLLGKNLVSDEFMNGRSWKMTANLCKCNKRECRSKTINERCAAMYISYTAVRGRSLHSTTGYYVQFIGSVLRSYC